MGQKTHPYGFRLSVIQTWSSEVVRGQELREWLHEDMSCASAP